MIEVERIGEQRDCKHCSRTYGTLGCCSTVSNKWVYSCEEGHREYEETHKHMTIPEAKGRLESFIDTFNICKEHDNSLVAVSIGKEDIQAFTMAIKSLETIQRIDDVLNVEGMTEIDILDEIMEAMSEFKYDCGVIE